MNNPTTLKEVELTFTPYVNTKEKQALTNLIEDGAYTSVIALDTGWVCATEDLEIHRIAIEETSESL
jgi:hypothetical protein